MTRHPVAHHRLGLALALALALAAACSVQLLDPTGRACDADHPCAGGRVCVSGVCVATEPGPGPGPDDGGGAEDDGGPGVDAGCVAGTACTVGLGECRRTGTLTCVGGLPVCSAQAGPPSLEVCDGLDNDCDGRRDVSREVVLAASDGGVGYGQLSWVPVRQGVMAVFRRATGSRTSEVALQRFSPQLEAIGAEVALSDPAGRAARWPSVVAVGEGAAVAWADDSATSQPRVLVARVDADGNLVTVQADGGAAPARRIFEPEDSRGRIHLALANDGRFLLSTWVGLDRLMMVTLWSDGTVYRPPTAVLDGGMRVQEVGASKIASNDLAVGVSTVEGGNAHRVRLVRFLETTALHSAFATANTDSLATDVRVVPVYNPDGGRANETVAAAWLDHDPGRAKAPSIHVIPNGQGAPVRLAAATDGGAWALEAVSTTNGPWVVWIQAENGRVHARPMSRGQGVDLTPPGTLAGGRSYPVGAAPALAFLDGGMVLVGYEVSRNGQGTSLHGQWFCVP